MTYHRIFLVLFLGILFSHSSAVEDDSASEDISRDGIDVATVPEWDSLDGQIRGGTDVQHVIPWYVVSANNALCGGVLIHQDIVMTTASCVANGNAPTQVRVGSLDRHVGGTVVDVWYHRVHPDWNGDPLVGNDIALLKLKQTLGNQVAIVNSVDTIPEMGATLFVMGYGFVADGSIEPPTPPSDSDDYYSDSDDDDGHRAVRRAYDDDSHSDDDDDDDDGLPTTDDALPLDLQGLFYDFLQLCQNKFHQYNPQVHLCADATPQQGACLGDTGSPAVLSGTRTVVGLSSFSDNFCESQKFDVYTRVSTYFQWVQDNVCQMAANKPTHCKKGGGNYPGTHKPGCFGWGKHWFGSGISQVQSGIGRVQEFFGF